MELIARTRQRPQYQQQQDRGYGGEQTPAARILRRSASSDPGSRVNMRKDYTTLVCDDQWVERQWPHTTGPVCSLADSGVGYVTVKLNPQFRHRRVMVIGNLQAHCNVAPRS